MNKKQIIVVTILTLVITFMDISGFPTVLFVNIEFADVTPYILGHMINFVLISLLAYVILKLFANEWRLGLHKQGLGSGLKKYAIPGVVAGVLSCIAFYIGLMPFDYKPTVWKVLFEGLLYYIGVAIIEELYVRGLFLNVVDKIFSKKEKHEEIAIWISSVVFGIGHIPGMIGMEIMAIIFKVISTIGMGLYFGTIYKKSKNLWVPIILHAFIDICALPYCFTTFSGYKKVSLIGLVLIYSGLGIYSALLMKKKV